MSLIFFSVPDFEAQAEFSATKLCTILPCTLAWVTLSAYGYQICCSDLQVLFFNQESEFFGKAHYFLLCKHCRGTNTLTLMPWFSMSLSHWQTQIWADRRWCLSDVTHLFFLLVLNTIPLCPLIDTLCPLSCGWFLPR